MAVNPDSHTASRKETQNPAQSSTHEDGNKSASQIYDMIKKLLKTPEYAEKISQYITSLPKEQMNGTSGETVLYYVIKHFKFESQREKDVFTLLLNKCPSMVYVERSDDKYKGQTPLHLAVCKGNEWLLNETIEHFKDTPAVKDQTTASHQKLTDILKKTATGTKFKNTVMMGELPLSIAALAFNKKAFERLLKAGAELDGVNTNKDNVCHSLIRYAYLYKEKMEGITDMLGTICKTPEIGKGESENMEKVQRIEKAKETRDKLLMMPNKDGLNPLQLAAAMGLHDIFRFIIGQKVYFPENVSDGVFDVKLYDITDIDPIWTLSSPKSKSILITLLDLEPEKAIKFVECEPVERCIDLKWQVYGKFFCVWIVLHVLFMSFLTWYSVERSKQLPNASNSTYDLGGRADYLNRILSETSVTISGFITLAVGVLYIIQDLVRVYMGRMPWTFKSLWNPYSNWWFRSICNCFGLCLILDVFLAMWSDNYRYDNYVLVVANVIGWFLLILLFRVVEQVSFFAILIQKVLFGDMPRFAIIIFIETIAFATAMYMAVQGSEHEEEKGFLTIGHVLFTMFSLMIGFGDLEFVYKTRNPGLCIAIFVFFVILTTIMMVNALIAMMTNTCAVLAEESYRFKLQKLAMVLLVESILPTSWVRPLGKVEGKKWYDSSSDKLKRKPRYILEVTSIESKNINDEPLDDRIIHTVVNSVWKIIIRPFSRNKRNGDQQQKPTTVKKEDEEINDEKVKERQDDETLGEREKKETQGAGRDEVDFFRRLGFTRPGEIDVYHIASYNKCVCTLCNCNKCNSTRVITHGKMAPDVNESNNINI